MDSLYLKNTLVIFAALLLPISATNQICEVSVLSQETYGTLFVPDGSSIHITCTANLSDQSLHWKLQSSDIPTETQYSPGFKQRFQSLGYYQLQENDDNIILYINNTDLNQTNITCLGIRFGIGTSTLLHRTLLTYDANQETIMLVPSIMNDRLLISWSPLTSLGARQVYNVTVVSENTQSQSFLKNKPNFNFSAPNNAPPCEVYNFSVTATPVGATYTGDGCSVPSPVLSRMLPSLPDIASLQSSLNYTLASGFGNGFQLKVFFTPANYCADYPVTDYVLEVEGPTTSSMSITPGSISTVDNLLENEMYSFHIIVSNSVGNVSTNKTTIYTTDVQEVTAELTEDNSFIVQCVFVTGSTARGCVVVLVGESDKIHVTVNLTREGLVANGTVSTGLPQATCITGVIGYDIESTGTIGTLPLSGNLSIGSQEMCMVKNPMSGSLLMIMITSVVVVTMAVVVVVAVVIVMLLICRKRKLKKRSVVTDQEPSPNSSLNPACTTIEETDQDTPLYDLPAHKQNVDVRTAGDGEDHSTNQYKSTTHTQYAELVDSQEHMYHVLECDRPPQGYEAPLPADDILSIRTSVA